MSEITYLYVMSAGVMVKIGFSKAPERRLRQLQTGQGETLVLIHKEAVATEIVRPLEKVLHADLRHHRIRGEWFNLSPEDAILEVKHAVMRYENEFQNRYGTGYDTS